MRLIQQDRHNPQQLAVSWMWLPTFIGQNSQLLGELDHVLSAKFPPPFELTDDKLDEIHRFVIDWVCSKIKVPGLWHYLRGVEDVGDENYDGPETDKRILLNSRMVDLLGQDRLAQLVENGQIEKHHNELTGWDLYYLPAEKEKADEPVSG